MRSSDPRRAGAILALVSSGWSAGCAAPAPGRGDAQPLAAAEFRKLRGQWRGIQIGGGATWTFSFGDENLVVARGDTGEWYQGLAVFHTEMGREPDGTIRVPPGSGVLDVDVTLASPASHAGQISLGTYFELGPDALKLCASRPGVAVRAKAYDASSGGVRCFRLERISSEPGGGRGERPPVTR